MQMLAIPSVSCSKQSAVSAEQEKEKFSDYVRRVANEKGLTYREVARRGGISSPSISDIISGETINIKASTIGALAKGLGVPEEEVFAAYRGKPLTPMSPTDFYTALKAMGVEQFQAYGGVETLTDEDRQEIVAMLQTLIEQKLIRRQKASGTSKKKR